MSASCCDHALDPHGGDAEVPAGPMDRASPLMPPCSPWRSVRAWLAGSASLQADALDFLGDAGNYAISLFVVGMALRYRATAALAKGATMGIFGLWVLGVTCLAFRAWELPQALSQWAWSASRRLFANAASFGLAPMGLQRRRREHALGMDLHAQ